MAMPHRAPALIGSGGERLVRSMLAPGFISRRRSIHFKTWQEPHLNVNTKPKIRSATTTHGYEIHRARKARSPPDPTGPLRESRSMPKVSVHNAFIVLSWDIKGREMLKNIPNVLLRDNCRCASCVNQDTQQRAFNIFAPENYNPRILRADTHEHGLEITWLQNDGTEHTSLYTWKWLDSKFGVDKRIAITRSPFHDPYGLAQRPKQAWGSEIHAKPPTVNYHEVMQDDQGLKTWLNEIHKYGFCFVDDVPASPEKTQELLERIAFIRVTHYGGFYDFTSDLTMKDTAYTSLALPAHTDTTYFTDPAGLQMFHLLSHTEGEGGASLLVDGLRCTQQLLEHNPDYYQVLTSTRVQWHASGNEGIVVTPSMPMPVITTLPLREERLLQLRWNNDDRAGSFPGDYVLGSLGRSRKAALWYEAAKAFNDIVTSSANEYWEQLKPGRALIFDNWRVMHGRSAFTGKRRMCGGYINHDDYRSRFLSLNYNDEQLHDWLF